MQWGIGGKEREVGSSGCEREYGKTGDLVGEEEEKTTQKMKKK